MANPKGHEFQIQFAHFLKKKFGFKCELEVDVIRSERALTEYNTYVIGHRLDKVARRMKILAYLYLAIFLVLFIGTIVYGIENNWPDKAVVVLYLSLIFLIGGLILHLYNLKKHTEYCWAECKNGKHRPTTDDIMNFIIKIRDFRSYKSCEKYFVSKNGFFLDAIYLAKKHGITLFTVNEHGEFEKYKYLEKPDKPSLPYF